MEWWEHILCQVANALKAYCPVDRTIMRLSLSLFLNIKLEHIHWFHLYGLSNMREFNIYGEGKISKQKLGKMVLKWDYSWSSNHSKWMLCSQECSMKVLLDFLIHNYVHRKFWTTNHLFVDLNIQLRAINSNPPVSRWTYKTLFFCISLVLTLRSGYMRLYSMCLYF